MKKITLLLLLMFSALTPLLAQNKDKAQMRKELEEYKMKYLAQEMELNKDQQKKFFEIYAQMSQERVKLFRETKALEKKVNSGTATDAEYKEASRALTAAKEKEAEIERRYDEKFSQFLTQKQIFKMKKAEQEFTSKVKKMHKEKEKSPK